MKDLIIALGTNTNRSENIDRSKAELSALFSDVFFTQFIETDPIGIECPKFINALASTQTELSYQDIKRKLKGIERLCGDSPEKRANNIVEMDLDILLYNGSRHHLKDWERPYITQLMKELP